MLKQKISQQISEKRKTEIKAKISKVKKLFINLFRKYDRKMLINKLTQMGISETDTLMVHANFKQDNGFKGAPLDIVNVLVDLVGKKGNLIMVSIPFRGGNYDYLKKNKPFRLRKTMSMMGLITEIFRRKANVLRSFHPTHPVLVYGKDSDWLVADHEKCISPCSKDSPFGKFRQLKGKILFFDVSFQAITFFHHVEEMIKDKLPFNIFSDEIFSVTAYDNNDEKHVIKSLAYSSVKRSAKKLEGEMIKQKLIHKGRVGNSNFIIVNAEDVFQCQISMVESGNYPYNL